MKQFLVVLVMTIVTLSGAKAALADSASDRTRAVITRSTDVVERPARARDSETADDEAEAADDEDREGSGVTLDVTYSNQGGIDIEFEAGDDAGDANISVSINGQSVSGTGGQNNGGNESNDGVDGQDGADGDASPEAEPADEPEEVTEEEESTGRADSRPTRDDRLSSDRDRR